MPEPAVSPVGRPDGAARCATAALRLQDAAWHLDRQHGALQSALYALAGYLELQAHLPDVAERGRAVDVADALLGDAPSPVGDPAAARRLSHLYGWLDQAEQIHDRFPGQYGAGRAAALARVREELASDLPPIGRG